MFWEKSLKKRKKKTLKKLSKYAPSCLLHVLAKSLVRGALLLKPLSVENKTQYLGFL